MTILNVPDMSCSHCVDRISTALREEKLDFVVNLENKTVGINGNDIDVSKAISVLDDIGYDAHK
ncbi:MAG: heavy-metal-associated domain-containing protein [Clostridiales bacterium]|nr:heavy-metal-associated domain-containing protein [Clostridiales bacterium]